MISSRIASVDFDRDSFTVGKNHEIPDSTKRALKLDCSAHIIKYQKFAVATQSGDVTFPLRVLDLEKKECVREMDKRFFQLYFSSHGPHPLNLTPNIPHPFPPLGNDKFLGAAQILNYGVFALRADSSKKRGAVDVVFILFRMDQLFGVEQSSIFAPGPEYVLRIHTDDPLNLDPRNCSVQLNGNILLFMCLLKDPDAEAFRLMSPIPVGNLSLRRTYTCDLNQKLMSKIALPVDSMRWYVQDRHLNLATPLTRVKAQKERISKKDFVHGLRGSGFIGCKF